MSKKLDFPPKHETQWVIVFPDRCQTQGIDFITALNMLVSGVISLCANVEQGERKHYLETTQPVDKNTQEAFDEYMGAAHNQLYDIMNTMFSEALARWSPDASSVPQNGDPMQDPDITVDALIAMQDLLVERKIKELPPEQRQAAVEALVEEIHRQTAALREESKMSEAYRAEVERRANVQNYQAVPMTPEHMAELGLEQEE